MVEKRVNSVIKKIEGTVDTTFSMIHHRLHFMLLTFILKLTLFDDLVGDFSFGKLLVFEIAFVFGIGG